MKKVLIMEDELNIRSFVVINLKRAGYDAIEAGNGQEALDAIAQTPDIGVAILDIMVPGDMDGFEVCRRIRATNAKIGIIMLTARTQEMDKVTGLMTGADDYVTKPFSPAELTARIDALYRRIGGAAEADPEVMQNPGRALSREDILTSVWGRDYDGELKIVDVNIRRLRIKIEDNTANPTYITTVWGYGYKWGL